MADVHAGLVIGEGVADDQGGAQPVAAGAAGPPEASGQPMTPEGAPASGFDGPGVGTVGPGGGAGSGGAAPRAGRPLLSIRLSSSKDFRIMLRFGC